MNHCILPCLLMQVGQCIIAGNIIADHEIVLTEFEPFSFYSFMLEYNVKTFFKVRHVCGGILPDHAEHNGQMCMIRGKPLLKILRLADLIKILSCVNDVNTFSYLYLLHRE